MKNQQRSKVARVAYFTQDFIGDVLVWLNQIEALASHYAPCEVTVFCSKLIKSVLDGYAFADRVIPYDPARPWSCDEVDSFGKFDAIFNTRYDADSIRRVIQLNHEKAYGFENIEIPGKDCKTHYNGYLPLTLWDDYHLRRETGVTAQGSELIKLIEPGYQCNYVRLEENTYVHDFTDGAILPNNRIVFVLGASDRTKHWGTERYITLALKMKERGYVPTFVLGPTELDYVPEIERSGLIAFKNLSFQKIAAVFSRSHGSRCVIGNDTGLMHFACMLGSPSVTIIPLGAHFTWFTYKEDKRAEHLYCTPECASPLCLSECPFPQECVAKVSSEQVLGAVNRVLGFDTKA